MSQVEVGKKVPDFTGQATSGIEFKLSDYKGSPILLYFYPKDNTPSCTQEGKDFRDHYAEFEKKALRFSASPVTASKPMKTLKPNMNFPLSLFQIRTKPSANYLMSSRKRKCTVKPIWGLNAVHF